MEGGRGGRMKKNRERGKGGRKLISLGGWSEGREKGGLGWVE